MYINRMRLLNVKPLHRDIPEGGGPLPEPARRRLVLQGANGSGKSTILETILTLWRLWGEWLDLGHGAGIRKGELPDFLVAPAFAGIQLVDIPGTRPVWICIGARNHWQDLQEKNQQAIFTGLFCGEANSFAIVEVPPGDFLARRQRSLAGAESFPNIVYFPPEGRTIRSPDKPRAEIIDTTQFNWMAVYDAAVNLDSILLTVQARTPERFAECLRLVNLALEHRQKRITGFGPRGRLVVKGTTEWGASYEHPIEALSSGERQILLLVGFAVAFLRPGGIVLLLDEPDLHIHIGMVDQLLETMERVVQERKGQLIVASHSVRVWEWFARPEEQIDLNPWRGSNT
jgi:energy-coupling factor transporter ATP-binding protein EcfA2